MYRPVEFTLKKKMVEKVIIDEAYMCPLFYIDSRHVEYTLYIVELMNWKIVKIIFTHLTYI
jgi:hypothetical protein